MKKYLVIMLASVMMMAGALSSVAQSRYGVIGGMTFSTSKFKEINRASMTQWHAGLTYKLDLPLGFSVQPSLVYHVKGAKLNVPQAGDPGQVSDFNIRMGFVELPVSLQWGPDLLVFRPFLDVTPYIGYALNNQLSGAGLSSQTNSWTGLNRFEYGLGVGIGLELWRFQVIGRYNWSFGSLADAAEDMQDGFGPYVRQAFSASNFRGITLSLAFLFGGGK